MSTSPGNETFKLEIPNTPENPDFYLQKCMGVNQPNRKILLYKSDNGDIKVDVLLQSETIWLPQSKIAELFE